MRDRLVRYDDHTGPRIHPSSDAGSTRGLTIGRPIPARLVTMTSLTSPQPPAPTTALAASARGLTKSFGRGDTLVHALRGVDLDLPAGRFTAIMGPSGSGKSTLMHCLAGLDQPTAGTVTVAGQSLEGMDDDTLTRFRRDHVGFVFQAFNLLPMLSAEQNIWLPTELAGQAGRDHDLRQRFDAIVETLGLSARLAHRPSELSGGQQQRVAIARALLSAPAIVFADEPTGNLDSSSSAEVLSLLRQSVRELGQTVVMVTHETEAATYADDVIVLADGRITERRGNAL